MNKQQTRFELIILSFLAELAGFYLLYYLLEHLLVIPSWRILPLWVAIGMGFVAVVLNLLLTITTVRIIFSWLINMIIGLGLTYLAQIWVYSGVFAPATFIQTLFSGPDVKYGWVLLVFMIILTTRAMAIVNRAIDYQQATHRFEAGIGVIFSVLLLGNVLAIPLQSTYIAVGICLLANIGALAFSRSSPSKPYWLGLALIIYGLIITAVVWLLNSLQPSLIGASSWLWGRAVYPVKIVAIKLFRWLFNYGNARGDSSGLANQGSQPSGSEWDVTVRGLSPEWLQHLADVLVWAAIAIGILLLALVLMYIIARLWYRRNPARFLRYSARDNQGAFYNFIQLIIRLFMRINLWLQPLRVGNMDITEIYRCLLIWGNLKHWPRRYDETPFEYGRRLGEQYPQQQEGIATLTASYVGWRFGQKMPNDEQLVNMHKLLRQLYY